MNKQEELEERVSRLEGNLDTLKEAMHRLYASNVLLLDIVRRMDARFNEKEPLIGEKTTIQ